MSALVVLLLAVLGLTAIPVAMTFQSASKIIIRTSTLPLPRPKLPYSKEKFALHDKAKDKEPTEPSAFDKVASMGLAGILAITAAEAIFWAAGVPLAEVYYKLTSGEWIDLSTSDGQIKAAGFSFGYGGFATVILQYRVTLFAIPLVPIMQKYVVEPGKKIWGDRFGESK